MPSSAGICQVSQMVAMRRGCGTWFGSRLAPGRRALEGDQVEVGGGQPIARRRPRGRWPRWARHCALKITKRRLTQKAAWPRSIYIGAPLANSSGSEASCALPA